MNRYNRSLVSYTVGIVLSIIAFFLAKEYLASGTEAVISLFVIILTALIDIRITQSEAKDALAFDKELYKNRWLIDQLALIIAKYTAIVRKHQRSPHRRRASIPYELARTSIVECMEEITDLEKSRWPLKDPVARIDLLIDAVVAARSTVFATSDVAFDTWWDSRHGHKYLKVNLDARQRNVNLERIFVVSQDIANASRGSTEDSKRLLQLIKKHEEAGAIILIAIKENLMAQHPPIIHDNILICDEDFAMWSSIQSNNAGIASYDKEDIHDVLSSFKKISLIADLPERYPFYSKLSASDQL